MVGCRNGVGRRKSEQTILIELGEIRTMEANLNRRFDTLGTARTAETVLSFLSSLQDLESRTIRVERLIEALDRQSNTSPVAA
jgi:hypothetical protein